MKYQILVVDDDVAVRKVLQRVLAKAGYGVLEAANGAETLAVVAAEKVDLVLLDLNLPGENGWDVFERLTTNRLPPPVIIITGRTDQLFPAQAAGVGALLEKPVDFPAMLQAVSRLLAESPEARLARMTGRSADFIYTPSPDPDGRTPAPSAG